MYRYLKSRKKKKQETAQEAVTHFWGHDPPVEKGWCREEKKEKTRWNLLRALVEVAHDAIILLF